MPPYEDSDKAEELRFARLRRNKSVEGTRAGSGKGQPHILSSDAMIIHKRSSDSAIHKSHCQIRYFRHRVD